MSENKHKVTDLFNPSQRVCGVWRYCEKEGGTITEQCDGCGKYRQRPRNEVNFE